MRNIRCLIILILLNVREVHLQTKADYKNILTEIFTTNGYDKRVLPNDDFSNPIVVDISFFFLGINEIDEIKEKFVTTGYLEIRWVDSGLAWNSTTHNGIQNIYVPQDDIWKPDIVLQNGFKRFMEMGGEFYYIEVYSFGDVTWMPFEVFESRCSLDTTYYPFDKQSCKIIFVVWSHSLEHVAIEKSFKGILFDDDFQENSVWEILSVTHDVSQETRESRITFTFSLRRKRLYYVINIILPVIFLGLLNGLVFVIPSESGEKTGYSVTVFLSLTVFLTIVSSLLPTNSDSTSALGVFLLIQLMLGVIVLFITTLQLRLCHRGNKPVTDCYKSLTKISRKLRCSLKRRPKVDSIPDEKHMAKDDKEVLAEGDNITWSDVAAGIDYICFWTFLFFYTILTVIAFGVMLSN